MTPSFADFHAEITKQIESDGARFALRMAAHVFDPDNVPEPEPLKALTDYVEELL